MKNFLEMLAAHNYDKEWGHYQKSRWIDLEKLEIFKDWLCVLVGGFSVCMGCVDAGLSLNSSAWFGIAASSAILVCFSVH